MNRTELRQTFFLEGLPRLWCPLISHYTGSGEFDPSRTRAHMVQMSPWVNSFLVPGSTGDGWEMRPDERLGLVDIVRDIVDDIGGALLIGVLETEQGAAARELQTLKNRYPADGSGSVCGAVVTAPKGSSLSQETIYAELAEMLDAGLPTALYQLPQITENEVAPETAARLADEYGNLYLLKDTSGGDRIAEAGVMPKDLFMVRGAEGDYLRWYRGAGGPYDGFLLSTANGFAPQLSRIISLADEAGEADETEGAGIPALSLRRDSAYAEAEELSKLLSRVVASCFELSADLRFGNPFANSNKAVDHWMAYGPGGAGKTPPMTHSGNRLPADFVRRVGDILRDAGMLPESGYLE